MLENMGKQYIKIYSSFVINNKVYVLFFYSIIFYYFIFYEYLIYVERRKEMYRVNDYVFFICIK